MRTTSVLGAAMALFLLGCGGGGTHGGPAGRGELTGIVFDTDGKPAAGARVYVDTGGHRETVSDSAGRYVLGDVASADVTVKAELKFADADSFYGQNLGRSYADVSTPNVNITLYDENDLVSLTGVVTDSSDRVVVGAQVYARSNDPDVYSGSSAIALTDRNGRYTIARLSKGVDYQVVGSARTYGDASVSINIPTTAERTLDLKLENPTSTAPATPTGLKAIAFTTPGATRGIGASAYEGLKKLRHPGLVSRTKRDSTLGAPISIDLTWDEYPVAPTVRPTGFIIYRNEAAALDNGYFLQDPLAVLFSDSDVNLVPDVSYTYTMKSVSTGFADGTNVGRSGLSGSAAAIPLDDLTLKPSSGTTVNWNAIVTTQGGSSPLTYTVYVYSRYPDVYAGDALVFSGSTTGTSLTVSDPDVTSGNTYYYIVVGARADGTSESYSEVRTLAL